MVGNSVRDIDQALTEEFTLQNFTNDFVEKIWFFFFITLYNTFTYHNFTAIWVVNICQGGALTVESQLSNVRIWPVVSELQQRFSSGQADILGMAVEMNSI